MDFLEEHPEYSRIAHQRDVIDDAGSYLRPDMEPELLDRSYTIEDFLSGRDYSDFGSVFRNYFREVGTKYHPLIQASRNVCDFQDMFITQDFGPVYVTSRSLGTYRIQTAPNASNYNSITSALNRRIDQIRICQAVERFYGGRYDLSPCIRTNQLRIAEEAVRLGTDEAFSTVRAYTSDPELDLILPELLYRFHRSRNRSALDFLRGQLGRARMLRLTARSILCGFRHLYQRITRCRPNPLFRGYVRK